MSVHKKTNISIDVNLDENNIPLEIKWNAPDGGVSEMDTKAVLLSLWDSNKKETLKIDLWVKEMPLDQMQLFFYSLKNELKNLFHPLNLLNK